MSWISVKDRLPDIDGDALAYFPRDEIAIAFFNEEGIHQWWHECTTAAAWEAPTHWQPLPDPPEDR